MWGGACKCAWAARVAARAARWLLRLRSWEVPRELHSNSLFCAAQCHGWSWGQAGVHCESAGLASAVGALIAITCRPS